MKLNKKELLRLIYEQDSEEIDVSSIIPKEEISITKDALHKGVDDSSISKVNLSIMAAFSDKAVTSPITRIFSDENVDLTDKDLEGLELHPYVQYLVDTESISDLRYAHVLSGNISYLNFLALNPKEFLYKRISWKYNKIIGYRGIYQGRYKNFYNASSLNHNSPLDESVGDFFVNLSKSDKGKEFIDLCKEYYGDDLKLTSDNNRYIDLILCMLKYSKGDDTVLYAMSRPYSADSKFNRQDLSVTLGYLFDLIQSDLEVYSNEFPSLNSLYLRLIKLIENTENHTNTYLVDNHYKIRLEQIRYDRKWHRCCRILREFQSKKSYLSEKDLNAWKIYALKRLDNYECEFISDMEFESKVESIEEICRAKGSEILSYFNKIALSKYHSIG